MTFKLVSCDGGGIRGYLSCLILQRLHAQTGFLDKADGFAGTSTGGLLAVALADGRSQEKDMGGLIAELVDMYRNDAHRIFRENERGLIDKALDEILKRFNLDGGLGIFSAHYGAEGLAEFGQTLVADRTVGSISSDIVLAINTVCLHRSDQIGWAPFTVTNQDLGAGPWLDMTPVKLLDVAMASAAAPAYFPPHRIKADGTDFGYFADGGAFANNPVLNGINIAIAAKQTDGLEDIEALSIGTGQQPADITEAIIQNPESWGLLKWFGVTSHAHKGALLEMLLTTSAENQYWMARMILRERLVRVNPSLSKPVGLSTFTPEAYGTMDEAFHAVTESRAWGRAVAMLEKW